MKSATSAGPTVSLALSLSKVNQPQQDPVLHQESPAPNKDNQPFQPESKEHCFTSSVSNNAANTDGFSAVGVLAEIKSLRAQVATMENKMRELYKPISTQADTMMEQAWKTEELDYEMVEMEASLKEKQNMIEELEDRMDEQQEEIFELEQKTGRQGNEIERLRNELNKMQESIQARFEEQVNIWSFYNCVWKIYEYPKKSFCFQRLCFCLCCLLGKLSTMESDRLSLLSTRQTKAAYSLSSLNCTH
jgi:DNA repair exonuclease SbcCD ATPase subunit